MEGGVELQQCFSRGLIYIHNARGIQSYWIIFGCPISQTKCIGHLGSMLPFSVSVVGSLGMLFYFHFTSHWHLFSRSFFLQIQHGLRYLGLTCVEMSSGVATALSRGPYWNIFVVSMFDTNVMKKRFLRTRFFVSC